MTGPRDGSTIHPDHTDSTAGHPDGAPTEELARCDGGRTPGRDRHRVLQEVRRELGRHPAVRSVQGTPSGDYRELQASLDPSWFGREHETASLRVVWVPDPAPGPGASSRASDDWLRTPIQAYYAVHYSEPEGFDCGFHCEPNPHVDGLLHYQQRGDADEDYSYEPVSFEARSASGFLWEVLDALAGRLGAGE